MKRILATLAVALVAVFAAVMVGSVTAAQASSCSIHQVDKPSVGGGVTVSFDGKCSVNWFFSGDELQYESGGTWHDFTKNGAPLPPFRDPPSGGVGANVEAFGGTTYQGLAPAPYHCYNIRYVTTFRGVAGGGAIASVTSPVLAKVDGPDC